MADPFDQDMEIRALQRRLIRLEEQATRTAAEKSPRSAQTPHENPETLDQHRFDDALRQLSARLAKIEDRWDRLDTRVGVISGFLDRLDARQDNRHSGLERELGRMRDNLPALITDAVRQAVSETRTTARSPSRAGSTRRPPEEIDN